MAEHGNYHNNRLNTPIVVSAPHRLDVSGTWDLKPFALLRGNVFPGTTNIAISLRTTLRVLPITGGQIRVEDPDFCEIYPSSAMRYDGRFGLVFAIVSFFQVDGVELQFSYDAPNRSGLGGSGVIAVLTIAALSKLTHRELSESQIITLAHHIEDGLRYSHTGLQDQCAAVYGGVNEWGWDYSQPTPAYSILPILHEKEYDELSTRLLVAYIGRPHYSSDVNEAQIACYLDGSKRDAWIRINQIGGSFAQSLRAKDWDTCCELLNEETALRADMVPARLIPVSDRLREAAYGVKAGFAAAGAGNGGCVWALCNTPQDAVSLAVEWERTLMSVETACLLDVAVAKEGLIFSEDAE